VQRFGEVLMGGLVPPLIVVGPGDVGMFDTLDELLRCVEPVNATDGDLVGFDARGRVIQIGGTVEQGRVFKSVTATARVTEEETPEVLAGHLRREIGRLAGVVPSPAASLAELVVQYRSIEYPEAE
jgi:hypothetical protein